MALHPTSGLRVAVVDDEMSVRFGLRSMLEAQGYAADLFESAEEFLARPPQAYCCILLDLWLKGGMNGLELLRDFPAVGQSAPVVMMTRQAEIPTAFQAAKLGVLDYLPKPIRPLQLSEVLGRARQAPPPAPALHLPAKLREVFAEVEAMDGGEWLRLLEAAAPHLDAGRMRQFKALSQREAQVLAKVAGAGLTNKEIGRELEVSEKTVDIHYNHLKDKLGIQGANARAAVLELHRLMAELLAAAGRLR